MRGGSVSEISAIANQQSEDCEGICHDEATLDNDDTKFFRRIHVNCMMIMGDEMAEERRIRHCGGLIDVDKAISDGERAVLLTPDGHAAKPGYLSILGSSFRRRFELSGDLIDIGKAICAQEQALHLTPDGHVTKAHHLNNLGSSLLSRFNRSGDLFDINMAISAQEQIVHLTPDGHSTKPGYLTSLGNSFLSRFGHSGDPLDIDKGISAYEKAMHLTPDGLAHKPARWHNLGNSYSRRYIFSRDIADASAAISHYRHAAHLTGSPSIRFLAALKWARLASGVDISSAVQGYTVAFDLLPQIYMVGHTIQARCWELTHIGEVACEAAAAAISAAQYDTALEWLEQGRSIVWSRVHHLRTPVDALREVQPSLADDLIRLSMALEFSDDREAQNPLTQLGQEMSMEEVAYAHRRLADEWEALVKTARNVPGFEEFLIPKRFEQLCKASDVGPVVVINAHKHRCDALVLIAGLDEVMHIALDRLSYQRAEELRQSLNKLLSTPGICAVRHASHSRRTTTTGADFPEILSDLWSYVAKPVLDGLAFTVSCLLFNCLLHFII
jgi:tetratricopeptide (TPR) repeat protein